MAKVTSLRLNDRAEGMLKSIKWFYEKLGQKISDTQIIVNGLEQQFNDVRELEDTRFKENILDTIEIDENLNAPTKEILKDMFRQICDLLEIACETSTEFLADEFERLMHVYGGGALYKKDGDVEYETSKVYLRICSKVEIYLTEKLKSDIPKDYNLEDFIINLFDTLKDIARNPINFEE